MKIAIKCESVLLEKALNIFLKPYLTSLKYSDFVVSDRVLEIEKPLFIVGKHIKKPFSKEELLLALANFTVPKEGDTPSLQHKKDENLESKVENLTHKFSQDLVKIIKDYYEK